MVLERQNEGMSCAVLPLRMRKETGELYERPDEVERAIAALLKLPPAEVAERSLIEAPELSGYISTECVLYFVRHLDPNVDGEAHSRLFMALRQRVLKAVRVPALRIAGSAKVAERATDLEIRDAVVHKFQMLLCSDRVTSDLRLDFYECRFNSALAMLQKTARKSVWEKESRREPVELGELAESSAEVEAALAAMRDRSNNLNSDFLYRLKLREAISALPPDERRIVELIMDQVPIYSQDKEAFSIAKTLNCAEKTVRNRRDRAFRKLRDALKEGGVINVHARRPRGHPLCLRA